MTFSTLFRSYVYIYGSFSTLLYYLIMQTNCEEWKQREIERGGGGFARGKRMESPTPP